MGTELTAALGFHLKNPIEIHGTAATTIVPITSASIGDHDTRRYPPGNANSARKPPIGAVPSVSTPP